MLPLRKVYVLPVIALPHLTKLDLIDFPSKSYDYPKVLGGHDTVLNCTVQMNGRMKTSDYKEYVLVSFPKV